MVMITNLDGIDIDLDEGAIGLVCGPYSSDVGPHTYVYAVRPKLTVTAEPPSDLMTCH
jgi:hypothetical protein